MKAVEKEKERSYRRKALSKCRNKNVVPVWGKTIRLRRVWTRKVLVEDKTSPVMLTLIYRIYTKRGLVSPFDVCLQSLQKVIYLAFVVAAHEGF